MVGGEWALGRPGQARSHLAISIQHFESVVSHLATMYDDMIALAPLTYHVHGKSQRATNSEVAGSQRRSKYRGFAI